jgi:hypothetical protein
MQGYLNGTLVTLIGCAITLTTDSTTLEETTSTIISSLLIMTSLNR